MKFKKISILLISIFCMLLITPIFFACSNSNQSNVNKVVIPESRYPEEEAELMKRVQVVKWQIDKYRRDNYYFSVRNSLAQDISLNIYFTLTSANNKEFISEYKCPRLAPQEIEESTITTMMNRDSIKDMQLRITEIHDSCKEATNDMNRTIQTSFKLVAPNYIDNTLSFQNSADATARVEITRSFTNGAQKSEIVEVQPLTTFKKTYSGDYSVATFTVKVLSLENSIIGKIADTMVISHTNLGVDEWKTEVTFKNIYNKTIELYCQNNYQNKSIVLKPQETVSNMFEYADLTPQTVRLKFIRFL